MCSNPPSESEPEPESRSESESESVLELRSESESKSGNTHASRTKNALSAHCSCITTVCGCWLASSKIASWYTICTMHVSTAASISSVDVTFDGVLASASRAAGVSHHWCCSLRTAPMTRRLFSAIRARKRARDSSTRRRKNAGMSDAYVGVSDAYVGVSMLQCTRVPDTASVLFNVRVGGDFVYGHVYRFFGMYVVSGMSTMQSRSAHCITARRVRAAASPAPHGSLCP